ncbi:MAG TPA: glycoside hydrolase family 38 C-terminal domain-containing protein, partial [Chthonomonadales bacterium]|nr:glycoside hydrolase family 38 C-terminal domain-containing protein [Chthonomonadales bacterium]
MAAAYGAAFDRPVEVAPLRQAWLDVLFNQFHDILPGSGVRETREYALGRFQEACAAAGAVKRTVISEAASRIHTRSLLPPGIDGEMEAALVETGQANSPFVAGAGIGAGLSGVSRASGGGVAYRPFVVFNPCAWPRSEWVKITIYDSSFKPDRIIALDEAGCRYKTLHLESGDDWGHRFTTVGFVAADVPAQGHRTYLLCEGEAQLPTESVTAGPNQCFETSFLQLRIDRYRSGISSLIDKRTGAELVNQQMGCFGAWQYAVERPRGMTAWLLGGETTAPEPLLSTEYKTLGVRRNQGTSKPLAAVCAGVRVDQAISMQDSSVRTAMMIYSDQPRLDFEAFIDWREIGSPERGIPGLLLSFPLALSRLKAVYETPFGSLERTLFQGEETPSLRYAHVGGVVGNSGKSGYAGVTLLQDSRYSHSIRGTELRLRIVRSSFDPDHAPEIAQTVARYSVVLHHEPPTRGQLARLGADWNHPLLVTAATLQAGAAPVKESYAEVQSANVLLTALKSSEDGDGILLRLVELDGRDGEAVVRLHPALTANRKRTELVDLMERPAPGAARLTHDTLRVELKPFSFVTVKIS